MIPLFFPPEAIEHYKFYFVAFFSYYILTRVVYVYRSWIDQSPTHQVNGTDKSSLPRTLKTSMTTQSVSSSFGPTAKPEPTGKVRHVLCVLLVTRSCCTYVHVQVSLSVLFVHIVIDNIPHVVGCCREHITQC